jgi:glucokinase
MLPGWNDVPLGTRLQAALDLPVAVDNDANAAGLAELEALGRPSGLNMVVLTVGTGIGAAIVIDGRLYRGSHGLAGELGNTTLDWQGATCWCGSRGCANVLASGSALERIAGELGVEAEGGKHLTAATVVRLARRGDQHAQQAVTRAAAALGALVANVVNTFNPDRVAIAGGMSELGEEYLAAIRAEVAQRAFAESVAQVRIERALHGERASAIGAAVLARDLAGGVPA